MKYEKRKERYKNNRRYNKKKSEFTKRQYK